MVTFSTVLLGVSSTLDTWVRSTAAVSWFRVELDTLNSSGIFSRRPTFFPECSGDKSKHECYVTWNTECQGMGSGRCCVISKCVRLTQKTCTGHKYVLCSGKISCSDKHAAARSVKSCSLSYRCPTLTKLGIICQIFVNYALQKWKPVRQLWSSTKMAQGTSKYATDAD